MLKLVQMRIYFVKISFVWLLISCSSDVSQVTLPMGEMTYPEDNPYSPEVAELGRELFFDVRLSPNNKIACASCHLPHKAFTDGRKVSLGFEDRTGDRNAPSLMNIGYHPYFMMEGGVPSLEMQALDPLRDSAEMNNDIGVLVEKLKQIPEYQQASLKLFQREFDAFVLTRALANFQRTLISQNSPFDQWMYAGNVYAVSEQVKNGFVVFQELECVSCHTPPAFTNFGFFNNGSHAHYKDEGRYRISGDSSDIGAFKVPTLRNIALTGPYMHNGSFGSLEQVLDNYLNGGQEHRNKDSRISQREISEEEKRDLHAFLFSLTDTSYLKLLYFNH